jgi:hypothetical protein
MSFKATRTNLNNFFTLTSLLGIDQDSLLNYLNWCLLEHLVSDLSQEKEYINKIKKDPKAVSIFKTMVEKRTNCKWDAENITVFYDRVKATTEKYYR